MKMMSVKLMVHLASTEQPGATMQGKLLSFISAISLDYKFHIPLLSMAGLILLCKNDARICFLLVQQDNAVV